MVNVSRTRKTHILSYVDNNTICIFLSKLHNIDARPPARSEGVEGVACPQVCSRSHHTPASVPSSQVASQLAMSSSPCQSPTWDCLDLRAHLRLSPRSVHYPGPRMPQSNFALLGTKSTQHRLSIQIMYVYFCSSSSGSGSTIPHSVPCHG